MTPTPTKCRACTKDAHGYTMCADCRAHFGYVVADEGGVVSAPASTLTHSQRSTRDRCLECGGLKREHKRVKGGGLRCPTKLKETRYTPWGAYLEAL